ncbi:MAG: beta-L-arabinofuranosidase domain-containing protein [Planctomycetaceae bacterium]|nr:glycoside hydrolase family 127 protein [Planctomycetaceae bacterium]
MPALQSLAPDKVSVGGAFGHRANLNRNYILSLTNDNLLRNFQGEAGWGGGILQGTMAGQGATGEDWHWGWETPTCQLRGHFPGHWLSGASRIYANSKDPLVKLRIDQFVSGLAACQERNGGEWAGSIPEKYLHLIARGQGVWAPHYTLHKMLMGLVDAYVWGANEQALTVLVNWAKWFHRWTRQFSREQMDNILDVETGGMLESWANLFAITGADEHRDLIERYTRMRLFGPLMDGVDNLTNMHANTTIPEAAGCARVYEVTGEARYRKMVEAYWDQAVTRRGTFCTGGQNLGEVWTPPFEFADRMGDKNQEFCTVYNMVRLADYLLRWTGEAQYADYIERNLYNGFLAQQHPGTGMVAYFLPFEPGGHKHWGHPTHDFWCCHGTLVQAHNLYGDWMYYAAKDSLTVAQYGDSTAKAQIKGAAVELHQWPIHENYGQGKERVVYRGGRDHRPQHWLYNMSVKADKTADFTLKLRMPWWLAGKAEITVNGKAVKASAKGSFTEIRRAWKDDTLTVKLPKSLWTEPIPDEPGTAAFMDGPTVLAGLCDKQCTIHGEQAHPEEILKPDVERLWGSWTTGYRTVNQCCNFRFKPLHEVVDEKYTVYFPFKEGEIRKNKTEIRNKKTNRKKQ